MGPAIADSVGASANVVSAKGEDYDQEEAREGTSGGDILGQQDAPHANIPIF